MCKCQVSRLTPTLSNFSNQQCKSQSRLSRILPFSLRKSHKKGFYLSTPPTHQRPTLTPPPLGRNVHEGPPTLTGPTLVRAPRSPTSCPPYSKPPSPIEPTAPSPRCSRAALEPGVGCVVYGWAYMINGRRKVKLGPLRNRVCEMI